MKKYSVYRHVKFDPDFREMYTRASPVAAAAAYYEDNKKLFPVKEDAKILVTWGFMDLFNATYSLNELEDVSGDAVKVDSDLGKQPSKVQRKAYVFHSGVH